MPRKTYTCEFCDIAVEGDAEFLNHTRSIHPDEQLSEDTTRLPPKQTVKYTRNSNGEYVCALKKCKRKGRPLVNKQTLKRHIDTHDRTKKPECPNCKKKFSRSDSLARHVKRYKSRCRRGEPLVPTQSAGMPGRSTQSHSLPQQIPAGVQAASLPRRRTSRGSSRAKTIVPLSSRQEGPRYQPYPSRSTAVRGHYDRSTVVTAAPSPSKAFSRTASPVEYPYLLPASAPHLAQVPLYTAPPGGSSHGSVAYSPWSYDLFHPIPGLGDDWEQTKMLENNHVGHTLRGRGELEPFQRFISPLLPEGHLNAFSAPVYRQPAANWHHGPLLRALDGVSAVGIDDAVDHTVSTEQFAERSTAAPGFDETLLASDTAEVESGLAAMFDEVANPAGHSLERELAGCLSSSFPGFGDDDMFGVPILPRESYKPPEDLEALFSHIEEFDLQFRECQSSAVELSAENDDPVDGSSGVDDDLDLLRGPQASYSLRAEDEYEELEIFKGLDEKN